MNPLLLAALSRLLAADPLALPAMTDYATNGAQPDPSRWEAVCYGDLATDDPDVCDPTETPLVWDTSRRLYDTPQPGLPDYLFATPAAERPEHCTRKE